MMERSVNWKFAAATSTGQARSFRRLPKQLRSKFKAAIERSEIPDSIDFETIGRISANVLNDTHFLILPQIEGEDLRNWWYDTILEQFDNLEHVFNVISRSSKPDEYAAFLAREEFLILPFFNGTYLFSDRGVDFEELPEEKRKLAEEFMAIYQKGDVTSRLVEMLEVRAIENEEDGNHQIPEEERPYFARKIAKHVIAHLFGEEKAGDMGDIERDEVSHTLKAALSVLERHSWARHMLVKTTLLDFGTYYEESEYGRIIIPISMASKKDKMDCYYVDDDQFWKSINARGIQLGSDILLGVVEESTVQHELQHLFDRNLHLGTNRVRDMPGWEYRARLAELLFASNPEESMKKMLAQVKGVSGDEKVSLDIYATAAALFALKEGLFRDNDMARILAEAKQELDQQYQKLVGLTYDEILEPFRK